jgi:hypothetical protein
MGGGPSISYQAPPQPDYTALIAAMKESNAAIAATQAAYQQKALDYANAQATAQLEYNKLSDQQQRDFLTAQAERQNKFQDEFSTKQNEATRAFQLEQQAREIQAAKDREASIKLAADQAEYNSAVKQAEEKAIMGQQYAEQQYAANDAVQKAYDAASAAEYKKQAAGAGKSYTGPSFDYNASLNQENANLRAAAPKLAPYAMNAAQKSKNPADKTAASLYANQLGNTQPMFTAPNMSGIEMYGGY